MKKILGILFILISMFYLTNVNAATASIGVSVSATQVIVNKQVTVTVTVSSSAPLGAWEYTLNYDTSLFRLTSSTADLHVVDYVSNNSTKSVSYKYTFTALKSGTGKFYIGSDYAISDFDENLIKNASIGSRNVKIITYAEYQASLSKNNNLSSLSVEGYDLDPVFNKDTLEYNVSVNEDEKEIKISATAEDKTAIINGLGTFEVTAGNNTFDIIVVAQNGSEKTYKLNVEVIDKEPIEVNIEGIKYTVVKLKDSLSKPEGYTESTVNINNFEIPSFYNDVIDYTLVGLKNDKGDIKLFRYDNNEYKKYVQIDFGNLSLVLLDLKEKDEFNNDNCKINKESVKCLSLNQKSRVKLIYALNIETGEEDYYSFDTKDNTFMRYDDEHILLLENQNKMLLITCIVFGLSTLFAIIMIFVVARKPKKKVVKSKEKETKQEKDEKEKIDLEVDEKNFDNIFEDEVKNKPKKKKKK